MSMPVLMPTGHTGNSIPGVTHDEALALLPPAYAQALQLQDRGYDEQQIAAELAIEAAAIGPLLRLANAKLARLLATTGQDGGKH
jgi:DNA-directed RNA polymerase specialized sigma24 family protein